MQDEIVLVYVNESRKAMDKWYDFFRIFEHGRPTKILLERRSDSYFLITVKTKPSRKDVEHKA